MHHDLRRNALTAVNGLLRKTRKLRGLQQQRAREALAAGMQAQVELLRSDLILILNQNFYLQCKLAEKDKTIDDLEQRCQQLQEKYRLNFRMIKMRYQKLLHNLKYEKFAHEQGTNWTKNIEDFAFCLPQESCHPINEELPTPKKRVVMRNARSALDNKETLEKGRGRQGRERQEESVSIERFDLEVRVREGMMSEQMTNLSLKPSVQMAKSNDTGEDEEGRKRKRGESVGENRKGQEGGGSKEELKMLIGQQFKVVPMKQKYFSTDLL